MRLTPTALLSFVYATGLFLGCTDDAEPVETTDATAANDVTDEAESDTSEDPGSGEGVTDSAADVSPYSGRYGETRDSEVETEITVAGLKYDLHVQIDEYGIPHVLAESVEDVFFGQGYLHARDRFPQMEFIRRATSGTLSLLAGALDDSIIEDDLFSRLMGFGRVAREIYDALDPDSVERKAVDAYAAGVNAYIDELQAGTTNLPHDYALLIRPIRDWEPWAGLAIIRYQQYDLGFDGYYELRLTRMRAAAEEAFPVDADDPRMAARAGMLGDIQRYAQADPTYQIPGFSGPSEKTARTPLVEPTEWRAPSPGALDRAIGLLEHPQSRFYPRFGDPRGMSNSWALSGEMTDTGHAMLANDPHLGLDSPTIFHQIHLVVEPRTEADGPALNAYGIMFPGLPGILIGHNENVAWGFTTASFDYVDTFTEELVWGDEDWPRIRRGEDLIELEIFEEEIEIGGLGTIQDTVTVELPWVPGRGPLAVDFDGAEVVLPREDEAISFAWRGFEASNEIASVMGWLTAEDMDDIEASLETWVIGTQNLLFADSSGSIFATGNSFIPQRPAAATDWDPVTNPDGWAPWWTLSGSGEHDWLDSPLDVELVPHSLNPEAGFLVTANNDQAGVTDDNNPLNDYAYIGYDYDLGFRAGRITRLLTNETGAWPDDHAFSLQDLGAIQTDHYSGFGERLAPFLVAAADSALAEFDIPGTHADLQTLVEAHAGERSGVQALRDLLAGWSFFAEDGLWGDPTADQKTDASATSLFNVWATYVLKLALDDEFAVAPGMSPTEQNRVTGLLWILEHPTEAATFAVATGQSALWDDLGTTDVVESRDAILIEAMFDAVTKLEEIFESSDPADWMWGELHVRRFEHQIPDISDMSDAVSHYDWPQPDEEWPDGYPRPGDNFNVDACNGGLGDFRYQCGGGATFRLLVELDPDGVRSFNALPGGQVQDYLSPHSRDLLMDFWLEGERYQVPFHPDQVAEADGEHLLLRP